MSFDPSSFVKDGITEEFVIETKKQFDLIDTNQNGSVDQGEVDAAIDKLGELKGKIYDALKEAISSTEGNEVDFAKFLEIVATTK